MKNADQLTQIAVDLAKARGFTTLDVHYSQGSIYIDCVRRDPKTMHACKAMLIAELPQHLEGRKLFHMKTHRGSKCWYLSNSSTVRVGLKIDLTERERAAQLLGSWDMLIAGSSKCIEHLDRCIASWKGTVSA